MKKQTILIPVDGSAFSYQIFSTIRRFFVPEETELILLEAVDPMARPLVEGDVVTATDILASSILYDGAGYTERQVEIDKRRNQREHAIRHQHEEALLAHAKELTAAGFDVKTHAESGDAAEQILSYADTAGVDLIAMATHGRSGLGKLVMGSVAQRVLHEASVPMLLLRPD